MQKACVVVRRKCESHEYSCGRRVYTRQSNFDSSPTICQQYAAKQNWDDKCLSRLATKIQQKLVCSWVVNNLKRRQYNKCESFKMGKAITLNGKIRLTESLENPFECNWCNYVSWRKGNLKNPNIRLCLMSEVVTWEAWLGQTKAGGVTDGIHLDFWDIMSIYQL